MTALRRVRISRQQLADLPADVSVPENIDTIVINAQPCPTQSTSGLAHWLTGGDSALAAQLVSALAPFDGHVDALFDALETSATAAQFIADPLTTLNKVLGGANGPVTPAQFAALSAVLAKLPQTQPPRAATATASPKSARAGLSVGKLAPRILPLGPTNGWDILIGIAGSNVTAQLARVLTNLPPFAYSRPVVGGVVTASLSLQAPTVTLTQSGVGIAATAGGTATITPTGGSGISSPIGGAVTIQASLTGSTNSQTFQVSASSTAVNFTFDQATIAWLSQYIGDIADIEASLSTAIGNAFNTAGAAAVSFSLAAIGGFPALTPKSVAIAYAPSLTAGSYDLVLLIQTTGTAGSKTFIGPVLVPGSTMSLALSANIFVNGVVLPMILQQTTGLKPADFTLTASGFSTDTSFTVVMQSGAPPVKCTSLRADLTGTNLALALGIEDYPLKVGITAGGIIAASMIPVIQQGVLKATLVQDEASTDIDLDLPWWLILAVVFTAGAELWLLLFLVAFGLIGLLLSVDLVDVSGIPPVKNLLQGALNDVSGKLSLGGKALPFTLTTASLNNGLVLYGTNAPPASATADTADADTTGTVITYVNNSPVSVQAQVLGFSSNTATGVVLDTQVVAAGAVQDFTVNGYEEYQVDTSLLQNSQSQIIIEASADATVSLFYQVQE